MESVHLEVAVDVPDKGERGHEGDGAQHEEEGIAAEESVAEELHCLECAIHVRPLHVVEDSIDQHKQPRRPDESNNNKSTDSSFRECL